MRELTEAGIPAELQNIELRDHADDITANLLHGFAPESLADAIDALTGSDGAIFVTPIFTTSYSGLFKSFLDILDPDSLRGLPVLIAATGGTERHSLALDYAVRPLFSYLHAVTAPTAVYAATSDWGASKGAAATDLPRRIQRAAAELSHLMADADRTGRSVGDRGKISLPAGLNPAG